MDERKNQFNKSISFYSQEELDKVIEYVRKLKENDGRMNFSKFVRQCIEKEMNK